MRYKVNAEIKKAKEIFYKNKLSESDCDALRTWQGINEHRSRKTGRSSIKELSLNGVCIKPFNYKVPLNNGSSFQEHISGLSERFQLVPTDSNQVLSLFLRKPEKI